MDSENQVSNAVARTAAAPLDNPMRATEKIHALNRGVSNSQAAPPLRTLLETVMRANVLKKDEEEAKQAVQNHPRNSLRAASLREILKWFEDQDRKAERNGEGYSTSKYERGAGATKLVDIHFERVLKFSKENMKVDKDALMLEFFAKTSGHIGYVYLEIICKERSKIRKGAEKEAEELVVGFLASKELVDHGLYVSSTSKSGSLEKNVQPEDNGTELCAIQANSMNDMQATWNHEAAVMLPQDEGDQRSLSAMVIPLARTTPSTPEHQQDLVSGGSAYDSDEDTPNISLAASGRSRTDTTLTQREYFLVKRRTWHGETNVSMKPPFRTKGLDPGDALDEMGDQERNEWTDAREQMSKEEKNF